MCHPRLRSERRRPVWAPDQVGQRRRRRSPGEPAPAGPAERQQEAQLKLRQDQSQDYSQGRNSPPAQALPHHPAPDQAPPLPPPPAPPPITQVRLRQTPLELVTTRCPLAAPRRSAARCCGRSDSPDETAASRDPQAGVGGCSAIAMLPLDHCRFSVHQMLSLDRFVSSTDQPRTGTPWLRQPYRVSGTRCRLGR
jgi:hypothetical protein